ncbi:helix-turn-helix domain-containing protein [Agromyces albus]|uniref:ArsR family transcriptional regulator n=1 Tax=Agromyces albus TaxID=205332 RepID=A0A4Q2KZ04_9MICO|nr:helix-turn-helix domain-containing protein [Agromyces albus]RXZ70945.1 ArsR family transcriptional regulator [Agromyces albus]
MQDGGPGDVRTIDEVRALAALAHPDRARLMDALAVDGPSTTGALASSLGVATGSVSHHLRVLTDAGLVERAPQDPADRRERRWKLVSRGMRWSAGQFRDRPAAESAATAAEAVMLGRQVEHARAFLGSAEPPWDDAAVSAHTWLRLSADELTELGRQLEELLLGWRRREIPDDGADRRPVLAFARAFPSRP